VVAASELAVAKKWLHKHPRSKKRPEWFKKRKRWEDILEDLRAWGVADAPDAPETGNPKLGLATDTEGRSPLTTCKGRPDKLSIHQESTLGDVAYSNHSRGEAKPSPLATTSLTSIESDERMILMKDSETSAMGSDSSGAEEKGRAGTTEAYHEVHDQIGALMRGGDGTVERFCGRMTSRHLEGEGFSFERLARILRGFVPAEPEMGEEEFAGIVGEVLDEIRAEHERQREASKERREVLVEIVRVGGTSEALGGT
jgi:hypothetical protein